MNTIKDYIEAVNKSLFEAKDAICKHCGCHFDKPDPGCKCEHDSSDPADDCWVSPEEYKKMKKESVNESASMNISMSGDNAGEVAELMKLMQNAGMADAGPVMSMPDMDHDSGCGCSSCADGHEEPDGDEEPQGPVMALPMPKDGPAMAKMRDIVSSGMEEPTDEEYANEPDEEYANVDYMTKDLSGGLNKQKKMYAKAQDGDNAMAVENLASTLKDAYDQFKAQYNESKKGKGKKPDFLDMDKDGDKEEPMSKAIKDKESKK